MGRFSLILLALTFSTPAFSSRYEAQRGCAKQAEVWSQVEASRYAPDELPAVAGGWSTLLTSVREALFLEETFSHNSDFMPTGRKKVIHGSGSVAKVRWKTDAGSPFTGLYRDSEACALVRLSLAASPDLIGFTPGMAVKVFVDGKPSRNLHVMHALNGQGENTNFFAHAFSNKLPSPEGLIFNSLRLALAVYGRDLTELDVAHLARVRSDGSRVRQPRAPRQIRFKPSSSRATPRSSRQDFRRELGRLNAAGVLYEIQGKERSGRWHDMGRLVLESPLVPSRFGDERLFFRHNQN